MRNWKQKGAGLVLMFLLTLVCVFGRQTTALADVSMGLMGETTLAVGDTETCILENLEEGMEVTWTSSYENIVEVEDTKGGTNVIKAIGVGTATIKATVDGTDAGAVLTVNTTLKTPVLKKPSVTGKSVTVKWESVPGADGYRIYKKNSSGVYKMVTDVPGEESTSYTDTGLTVGQSYTYSVKAYAFSRNDGATVFWSERDEEGKTAKTKLKTPALISASMTDDSSVQVEWEEVADAESYNIYRKYGKEDWKKVGNVEGTKFEDKDVTIGTTYTYTVRAVADGKKSGYVDDGISCMVLPKKPELSGFAVRGKQKLEVRWEAVEKADGYRVYRKNSKGKWVKKADVTKNLWLDTSVEYNTNYTYTVRSWVKVDGKKILSGYNEEGITGKTVAAKKIRLESPVLKKASAVDFDSIKVTWEKVGGADGYIVYRKTADSDWKKLKELEGADVLSYTDSKCTFGTKYTYTVRAYVMYDTTVVRSVDYDETGVSAKTKLGTAKLTGATSNGLDSITVKWEALEGAQGYRVYRKTADTDWKKIKTIDNVKTTSYTDKSIKANVKYTYTVRGYRKVGDDVVLGGYNKKGVSATAKITSKYKNGLKLYYDGNGKLIEDVENIIGKQSSYYIMVNKKQNIVTVYAKDENGKYCVPVKAFICSTGADTPLGTFKTPAKYRWQELMGPCWGQWCTRITGSILFHSVYYNEFQDNMSLSTYAYNKLGTQCSHGCVRLTAGDSKWIYDNCSIGTTVKIYESSAAEPFSKPTAYKLSSSHTWDPTDPIAYEKKCKKLGCH